MRVVGAFPSDEGAQSDNGLADDQRLSGAFVGVDRFRVGHEASDVVFEQDAIAAEQLSSPGGGLQLTTKRVA